MGCKFNVSAFQAGLRAKQRATGQAASVIINQAGGSVVANAIRLTPKADPAKIEAALTTGGLAFRLLQSPRFQSRLPRKLRGFTRGSRHTRAQIDAAVRELVALRRRSTANLKRGWFKALKVFRPGFSGKVSEKSLAGQGRASKATPGRLKATFENHAAGAEVRGAEALQQALDEEGASLEAFAARKLSQAWR